jgi:hypothetical protein
LSVLVIFATNPTFREQKLDRPSFGDKENPMTLDTPIARYFATADGSDPQAFASAFTADAIVTDEGRTYRGRDEITAWRNAANAKYRITVTPNAVTQRDGKTVVTALVAGDFPKAGLPDPLFLEYRFELRNAEIASLSIGLPR